MYLCFKGFSDSSPKEIGEIHSGEKLPVKCIFYVGLPSDYENFQFACDESLLSGRFLDS